MLKVTVACSGYQCSHCSDINDIMSCLHYYMCMWVSGKFIHNMTIISLTCYKMSFMSWVHISNDRTAMGVTTSFLWQISYLHSN